MHTPSPQVYELRPRSDEERSTTSAAARSQQVAEKFRVNAKTIRDIWNQDTLSHQHTPTHTRTRCLSLTHPLGSHTHPLSHTRTRSHTRSLARCLSHTLIRTLSLTHAHARSLTHSLSHTRTRALSLTHTFGNRSPGSAPPRASGQTRCFTPAPSSPAP